MAIEDKVPSAPRRKTIVLRYYLYALLATALLFMVMAYGFEYNAPNVPEAPDEGRAQAAPIIMLPSGSATGNEPWQRQLEAWITLRDPTLLSLPNDKHGFSEILRIGFERPFKRVPERDMTLDLAQPMPTAPIRIAPQAADPVVLLDQARLAEPPRLPQPLKSAPVPPGVYITDMDGDPFTRVPELQLAQVAQLGEAVPARRPTEITTMPHGRQLRVTVTRSSGNARLDQLAVTHVRRLFISYPSQQTISEEMSWWLAQDRVLLVHWRFAPNVTNTSDPANEANTDDRGWL